MKQFRRGLVVGKFCPLHRGHQLVIDRAFATCDEVIIISYTKPEFDRCEPAVRDLWLASLYPAARKLVLDDQRLAALCRERGVPARVLPDNDAADEEHREFVAWICAELVGTSVDAVFTSESYGPGFASHLAKYFGSAVSHVAVDPPRKGHPITGTAIRANPMLHRGHLAPEVYADLVPRVCILGGESTGKTTLARDLAEAVGTRWVPEYGRELWEQKGGALAFEDMLLIARQQVRMEQQHAQGAARMLVCDTSPLTTMFYSEAMFERVDPELARLADRRYDYILLCMPDFAFVQDGTRKDADFRERQHQWYLTELMRRKWPCLLLQGDRQARMHAALERLLALG